MGPRDALDVRKVTCSAFLTHCPENTVRLCLPHGTRQTGIISRITPRIPSRSLLPRDNTGHQNGRVTDLWVLRPYSASERLPERELLRKLR